MNVGAVAVMDNRYQSVGQKHFLVLFGTPVPSTVSVLALVSHKGTPARLEVLIKVGVLSMVRSLENTTQDNGSRQ